MLCFDPPPSSMLSFEYHVQSETTLNKGEGGTLLIFYNFSLCFVRDCLKIKIKELEIMLHLDDILLFFKYKWNTTEHAM